MAATAVAASEVGTAPSGLRPVMPPGMARGERTLVGHRAVAIVPEADRHRLAAVWAALAETAAALDARVPGSDLSRLRPGGRSVVTSASVLDAVASALGWAAATDGGYDPTRRRGLDAPAGRWREVTLDVQAGAVRVPADVSLDLSDVFGAFAVEASLQALATLGTGTALVQVDNCLAVRGRVCGGWTVGVGPRRRALRLEDGAVAVGRAPSGVARLALGRGPTAPEAAARAAASLRAGAGRGHRVLRVATARDRGAGVRNLP